jgi:hypothetical protein
MRAELLKIFSMKWIVLIFVFFLITACNNTQQQTNADTTVKILSKQEIPDEDLDSLHNPSHFAYLSNLDLKVVANLILKDSIMPRDNYVTFRCMDSISSGNLQTRMFYFPVFIKIVGKSDGALSEAVGDYCMKYLKQYPQEFVQRKLSKEESEKIAGFTAYELAYWSNESLDKAKE